MLKEFKEFAVRGNMVDLAVAVVLGVAFGAVVASLVKDVLMPPIGKLVGGVDFTDLFVALDGRSYPSLKAAKDAGVATLNYGLFLNTIINFILVALALFVVVKSLNRMRGPVVAVPVTKDCAYCATPIPLKATRCPHCTSALSAV